jgi:calcineurin-binding protein cabin-1
MQLILCLQNSFVVPESRIGDLQSLLLVVMCNVASNFLCKKSSGPVVVDETDQKQQCCFVDAATAFCKLQHLNPTVPVKTQVNHTLVFLVTVIYF